MCYEFLYGIPPFNASNPEKVFDNIVRGTIHWHEDPSTGEIPISEKAKDFITRLLDPDPSKRLGANGPEEVRAHPFFDKIEDWGKLREETPSFIPMTEGWEDTDYFDGRGVSMGLLSKEEETEMDEKESTGQEENGMRSVEGKGQEEEVDKKGKAEEKGTDEEKSKGAERQSEGGGIKEEKDGLLAHAMGISGMSSGSKDRSQSRPERSDSSSPPSPTETDTSAMMSKAGSEDGEFGTFTYRNLDALQRANEEVIRKLRDDRASRDGSISGISGASSLLQHGPSSNRSDEDALGASRGPGMGPPSLHLSASTGGIDGTKSTVHGVERRPRTGSVSDLPSSGPPAHDHIPGNQYSPLNSSPLASPRQGLTPLMPGVGSGNPGNTTNLEIPRSAETAGIWSNPTTSMLLQLPPRTRSSLPSTRPASDGPRSRREGEGEEMDVSGRESSGSTGSLPPAPVGMLTSASTGSTVSADTLSPGPLSTLSRSSGSTLGVGIPRGRPRSGSLSVEPMGGGAGVTASGLQQQLGKGGVSRMTPGHLSSSHVSRPLQRTTNGSSVTTPPLSNGPWNCLIADDNPVSCRIMETMLKRLNGRCVVVRNGAEALRCAMGSVKFDIIFMDIVMPICKLKRIWIGPSAAYLLPLLKLTFPLSFLSHFFLQWMVKVPLG